MEDLDIIELYWQREEEAISETKKKYGNYLFTIANNILKDDFDSEEVVDDTYLKTWNRLPPERPSVFSAFLAKITRQFSIDRYRFRNAQKRGNGEYAKSLDELADMVSGNNDPVQSVNAIILAESINRFLWSLPQKQRSLFVLRYFHCVSLRQAASCCGYATANAKTILFRLRQDLRAYLNKEGYRI
jgi:RNA polymerase sigma-70 factor (ECF subfamily)